MDTKYINLKFISGNKTLEVGKGKPFRLLNIEGIESGEYEIYTIDNVMGDGITVTNRRIKYRSIILEVEYTGNRQELERPKLANFFNLYNSGKLIINYQGTERLINYVVEGYKAKSKNLYEPFKFLVALICPNPYWQDVVETKEEIAIWRPAFEFPLELIEEGIEMGYREPSLIVNIYNEGDVACGMKIQFKALATVVNPSLFNINTREYFKINKTMSAGEIITVTTGFGDKKVYLDSNGVVTNAFNYIDLNSTFLQLEVGDNLFRYDADEGIDNLEVSIYYTPQYLGV